MKHLHVSKVHSDHMFPSGGPFQQRILMKMFLPLEMAAILEVQIPFSAP